MMVFVIVLDALWWLGRIQGGDGGGGGGSSLVGGCVGGD